MKIQLIIIKYNWLDGFFILANKSKINFRKHSCVYLSQNGIHRYDNTLSFERAWYQSTRTFYKEILKYLK